MVRKNGFRRSANARLIQINEKGEEHQKISPASKFKGGRSERLSSASKKKLGASVRLPPLAEDVKETRNHSSYESWKLDLDKLSFLDHTETEETADQTTEDSLERFPSLHDLMDVGKWRDVKGVLDDIAESGDALDYQVAMTSENERGETPLMVAVWKAPQRLALYMLETIPVKRRAFYLLMKDSLGNTPLHLCCANLDENVEFTVIKNVLLLAPEALDRANYYGDTPLHLLVTSPGFKRSLSHSFVVEAAAEEAITTLLTMINLAKVQNNAGMTLLHCGIAHGVHERVLVRLLEMAPEAASMSDRRNLLPVHYVGAFAGTPWTFVQQLIEAFPQGICRQDENGDTPLHLLISNSYKRLQQEHFLDRNTTKTAELLVLARSEKGDVSPLFVKNHEDLSPLHCIALFASTPQLTRLIMNSDAADAGSAMTTAFGATALHLACASSSVSETESVENIEALATRHACSMLDDNGRTPLIVAVQNDRVSRNVIKKLTSAYPEGANLPSSHGFLPIHVALEIGAKESVIRTLVKASPQESLQATTKAGDTALHLACANNAPHAVIKLLLHKYKNARRVRNVRGELPIDLCRHNGVADAIPDLFDPQSLFTSDDETSAGEPVLLPKAKQGLRKSVRLSI